MMLMPYANSYAPSGIGNVNIRNWPIPPGKKTSFCW